MNDELKLIDQAIESAKCRIYRLRVSDTASETHQKKAENKKELMRVTIKALESYREKLKE